MSEEVIQTETGKIVIKKPNGQESKEETLTEKLGLTKYKLASWIYPLLTFVIGDVTTTYYATQKLGLHEQNPIVLLTGLHANPLAFTEIKLYLLTFAFILTTIMYGFLSMAKLNDIKDYLYYLIPLMVGTISLAVVINNIVHIIRVI